MAPETELRRLSLRARVLLCFCRSPWSAEPAMSGVHYEAGKELDRLAEVFPAIRGELADKTVIDFGCGLGYQCVALVRAGARRVVGIEIDETAIRVARRRIADQGLAERVSFANKIPDGLKADVILSQNSFEHFLDAAEILAKFRAALAPGGKVFVTFAPPWYAAWGAHTAYFCRLPWVQLFFSERTVMEARSMFRSDGAKTYREGGLAEMSLTKFERFVGASGLRYGLKRYDCSRGLDWLKRTPLREFFVNRVSCILVEPGNTPGGAPYGGASC